MSSISISFSAVKTEVIIHDLPILTPYSETQLMPNRKTLHLLEAQDI